MFPDNQDTPSDTIISSEPMADDSKKIDYDEDRFDTDDADKQPSRALQCFVFIVIAVTVLGLIAHQQRMFNHPTMRNIARSTPIVIEEDSKETETNTLSLNSQPDVNKENNPNVLDDASEPDTSAASESFINNPLEEATDTSLDEDTAPESSFTGIDNYSYDDPQDTPVSTPARESPAATQSSDIYDAQRQLEQDILTLQHDNDSLKDTVAELQTALHALSLRAEKERTLYQFFSLFKQQVLTHQPYQGSFQALLQSDILTESVRSELDYFKKFQRKGIKDKTALSEMFDEAINRYYDKDKQSDASADTMTDTVTHSIGDWASSLVKVRKIGDEHMGADDTDIIARAESYVEQQELANALAELRGLSPEAMQYFKDWMMQVKPHVKSRELLEKIEKDIFTMPVANSDITLSY